MRTCLLAGLLCILATMVLAAPGAPIAPSPDNPALFAFQGHNDVKLIGYDYYGLFSTANVSPNVDWRTGKQLYWREFLDMLHANGCNFERVFAIDPWANSHFPWRRYYGPGQVEWRYSKEFPAGEAYPLVNLEEWDDFYWHRVRSILRYASKLGIVFEISLVDECGLESGPGDHRWPFHPFSPQNNLPGTLGKRLIEPGHHDGLPEVYDLSNPAVKTLYERYFAKWVEETRGLDNVIFEIGNESTSGLAFHKWAAHYLKHVLHCPFPIAANAFRDADAIYRLPDVDVIATHGKKTPAQVVQWIRTARKKYGKILVLDTDGWYDSEQTFPNTLQCAQTALDLDCHFNHKARTLQVCGKTGKTFLQLMGELQRNPKAPSPWRVFKVESPLR